ncbi:MAG: acetylglutamate kinase [Victivallaceae bacterium]|nr:acetylglutamate kinase [Victivallaceae bacterium]
MIDDVIAKAGVLVEALPYIQKFRNSIMLVKFGGSAMEDPELVRSAMCDVVMLEAIGVKPVIVHGGGKAISAELKKLGIPVKFVFGLRYTCDQTIKVVDDVLHNVVNKNLVELGEICGGRLVGISGKQVLRAKRTMAKDPTTGELQDIGFVGEVEGVNAAPIMNSIERGMIPVVTPLGIGKDGTIYNINADVAASKIAQGLHARKLVFMSDVPGILADKDDPKSVIPTIVTSDIQKLIADGVLSGGMLPKIASCVEALESGINKVHMIDGRVLHSLLLEIFTDTGIGTQIVSPASAM